MSPAELMERSRGVILAQWGELLRLRKAVLKTSDPDAIHDLRVASRRLRAAVALFEPWMPPKSAALLKKRTRKLTRVLGGLRNIDEAILFFRAHTPDSGGGYRICRRLAESRPGELARIKKALSDFDGRRLGRKVRKAAAWMEEGGNAANKSPSLPAYFSDTCIRLFQPIHDLLPGATFPEERRSRHALRIAIKKWRYFFEIVAPVMGCEVSSTVGLLKEYQMILGRMNDVVEFGGLCGELKLTRHERGFAEAILRAEDQLLLHCLAELIEQNPLVYTFPF